MSTSLPIKAPHSSSRNSEMEEFQIFSISDSQTYITVEDLTDMNRLSNMDISVVVSVVLSGHNQCETNPQIPWTSLSIVSHQHSKTTWPSSSNSSVTPAGCSHGNKDNISDVNVPIKELLNSTGHSKQVHAVCCVPGHKTLWKYRGYVEIFPQV